MAKQEEFTVSVEDSSGFERALKELDRDEWSQGILIGNEFLILKSAKGGKLVVMRRQIPETSRQR